MPRRVRGRRHRATGGDSVEVGVEKAGGDCMVLRHSVLNGTEAWWKKLTNGGWKVSVTNHHHSIDISIKRQRQNSVSILRRHRSTSCGVLAEYTLLLLLADFSDLDGRV